MARIDLALIADEESSYLITGTFLDEAGQAVVPTAASWRLTDLGGVVINGRASVALPLASTFAIVLKGPDLPIRADLTPEREVLVWFRYVSTYDSAMIGNVPIRFVVGNSAGES